MQLSQSYAKAKGSHDTGTDRIDSYQVCRIKQIMYDIEQQAASGKLTGRKIYLLNEAIFEWTDEGNLPKDLALAIFGSISIIRSTYLRLHQEGVRQGAWEEMDGLFLYDYLALLGTVCNQHCWSMKLQIRLLAFLKEAAYDIPIEHERPLSDRAACSSGYIDSSHLPSLREVADAAVQTEEQVEPNENAVETYRVDTEQTNPQAQWQHVERPSARLAARIQEFEDFADHPDPDRKGFKLTDGQWAICKWFGHALDVAQDEELRQLPLNVRQQNACLLIGAGGTGKTTIIRKLLLPTFLEFFPAEEGEERDAVQIYHPPSIKANRYKGKMGPRKHAISDSLQIEVPCGTSGYNTRSWEWEAPHRTTHEPYTQWRHSSGYRSWNDWSPTIDAMNGYEQ